MGSIVVGPLVRLGAWMVRGLGWRMLVSNGLSMGLGAGLASGGSKAGSSIAKLIDAGSAVGALLVAAQIVTGKVSGVRAVTGLALVVMAFFRGKALLSQYQSTLAAMDLQVDEEFGGIV